VCTKAVAVVRAVGADFFVDLRKIGLGDMDWIYLAQDRDQSRALVRMVMSVWVP
jgi:hypothetical protein